MISAERKLFFSWLSSGVAASSLALVVFIPTLDTINSTLKLLSIAFFIVTITFSVTAVLMHKEMEVFAHNSNKQIKKIHHAVLLVALICYLLGFSVLFWALSFYLLILFIFCLILCNKAFKLVQKEIDSDLNSEGE